MIQYGGQCAYKRLDVVKLGKGLGCAASVSERIQALNNATHCDKEGRRVCRMLPGVKIWKTRFSRCLIPKVIQLAGYCLKTRLTLVIFLCMTEHVVFDFFYTQLSNELEYWR